MQAVTFRIIGLCFLMSVLVGCAETKAPQAPKPIETSNSIQPAIQEPAQIETQQPEAYSADELFAYYHSNEVRGLDWLKSSPVRIRDKVAHIDEDKDGDLYLSFIAENGNSFPIKMITVQYPASFRASISQLNVGDTITTESDFNMVFDRDGLLFYGRSITKR